MHKKKVAFFTEAGTNRGMGHLVRSYSLYEEFSKEFECNFYLDSDIDFNDKYKNINIFNWEDFSIDDTFEIVFIDSYLAPLEVYEEISKSCKIAVYLDDYHRIQYPKGIILNFAPEAEELFFKEKKEQNHYLLGPKYIPIRKEFLEIETLNIKKDEKIFLSFGGFANDEVYIKVLKNLEKLDLEKVVVSNSTSLLEKIENFAKVRVLNNPDIKELAHEMSLCTIAICTASMVVYELNYFGIPCYILALSKNQEIGSPQFIRNEFAVKTINLENLDLNNLLLSKYCKKQIDGKGAKRVLEYLLKELNK